MQRGGNAATGAGAGVPAARARARPSHVYLSADRMPFRVDPVHGVEELAAFEALLGVTPEPPNQDLAAFLLEAQGLVNTGEFTWADYDAGGDGLYGDSVTEGLLELGIDPATIGEDGAPADDVRNRDFSAWDADDCREPASLPRKRKALVSVQKIAGVLSRRALLIDGHWQRVLAQPNARCQTCHGEDAAAAAVLCYCLGPFGERLCISCDRRRHQTACCKRRTLLREDGCGAPVVHLLDPNSFIAEGAVQEPGGGFKPELVVQGGESRNGVGASSATFSIPMLSFCTIGL
jgi:hypothetical protein